MPKTESTTNMLGVRIFIALCATAYVMYVILRGWRIEVLQKRAIVKEIQEHWCKTPELGRHAEYDRTKGTRMWSCPQCGRWYVLTRTASGNAYYWHHTRQSSTSGEPSEDIHPSTP
jgi:hypothetical protein